MLLVHTTITNITILSIFKIILFEFDYRTVNVFTSKSNDDVMHEMMNILKNHSKPTHILNFDMMLSERKRCEEPILNVLFVDNNSIELFDEVKQNIYPNDISLILHFSISNSQTELQIQSRMLVSSRVFIINHFWLLARHPIQHRKMDEMPLYPFDIGKTKTFIQSYIHLSNSIRQERNLTIFLQYLSPRSMIGFVKNSFYYIGADGSITAILLKKLNATGVFVSDVGLIYPSLVSSWGKIQRKPAREDIFKYYKNALTSNNITDFNRSMRTSSVDLHMSPYVVLPDIDDQKLNLTTEHLYPHERDCVVVVVPKQSATDNFLKKVIKNGDIQSIALAMLLLIIMRIVIEKASIDKWFSITFKTIGLLFSQVDMKNYNSFESAWTNIVRGFSTIATIVLSAIIYNNMVNNRYNEIDTINKLIASNLTVLAPYFLRSNLKMRLSVNRPQLLNHIEFKEIEVIGSSIIAQNLSFAYILYENQARNYLKIVAANAKEGDSGRIMKENLYCNLNSYRINLKSTNRKVVDDFILRTFENGLYTKHLQWANALLNALFRSPQSNSIGFDLVLTLDMISGVFHIFIIGIIISCIVFLIENCFRRLINRNKVLNL